MARTHDTYSLEGVRKMKVDLSEYTELEITASFVAGFIQNTCWI